MLGLNLCTIANIIISSMAIYCESYTITIATFYRNEEYQGDLWRQSFDFLKDHLSPEIMEKYGPPDQEPAGTDSGEQYQDKQNEPGATDAIEATSDDGIKIDT